MIRLVMNPYKTNTLLSIPTEYFSMRFLLSNIETIPVRGREKKVGLNMGLRSMQEGCNHWKTEFEGRRITRNQINDSEEKLRTTQQTGNEAQK